MTDFVDRLQAALGSAYRITRELGGGGMSRVFLADDTALDRPVVIKLLHPELAAGINAERFKREVQVLARLQHPHIVPVLSAGEFEGLPYYIMPFVKGESLRARLAHGALPPAEAAALLADTAKALAAAHAEGVVHRDIKPDNILVTGGSAVVADFGIAKALTTARSTEGGATLTSLGTSLGTPAYMAPEQVAGDPNIDHRADLYSLGCVGYELLTGASPFAGKSPQQMLAAHVVDKPTPIADRVTGVPPMLASAIMRCLEKEPANRPQSAAQLAPQLDASVGSGAREPVPLPSRRSPLRVAALGTAVAAIAVGGWLVYRAQHRPAIATDTLAVAVAPFEILDPQLALWKEGIVDVLSRDIDGAGPIRSISPTLTIKKWEGRADRASAVAFGKRVGARLVIYGQLEPAGKDLVNATVWIADAASDAQPLEAEAKDSSARMDRVSDSLGVRILAAIGRAHAIGAARVASLGSGSLPAIKAFLQGAQYFRRTQWDSAAKSFEEAVARDSMFGIAYAMLGQSYGWSEGAGGRGTTENYAKAGARVRAGLSPHDSLIQTALGHYAAGLRGPAIRHAEYQKAYAAGQAATTRYPDDPQAWYLLGDIRYHTDQTMSEREALAYFDHAIQADSEFAPAYIHAIEISYQYGAQAGHRYTQAYLARNPRDLTADAYRLAMVLSDEHLSAAKVREILDTAPPRVYNKTLTPLVRLPDSAEIAIQIGRAAARKNPANKGIESGIARVLAMRGHVAEAWHILAAQPDYQVAELVGLGLIPADSAAKVTAPLLDQMNDAALAALPAFALAHDTARLAAFTKKAEAAVARPNLTDQQRLGGAYFLAASRAYQALARRDTAAATRLFDAIPDSTFNVPMEQFIRARLLERKDPQRALALLERNTSVADLLYAARALERGRLAEQLGQRDEAVQGYAYAAAVWQNADAGPLRDGRDEARAALKRLDSDGRLRATLGSR